MKKTKQVQLINKVLVIFSPQNESRITLTTAINKIQKTILIFPDAHIFKALVSFYSLDNPPFKQKIISLEFTILGFHHVCIQKPS